MGDSLKGKIAIVTGSGQGIGRAIAYYLAEEGAKVVTNNRKPGSTGHAFITDAELKALTPERRAWFEKAYKENKGDAETTAAEIRKKGGDAFAFFGDMADFNKAKELADTAKQHYGKIDILVNVVGTFGAGPIWTMSEALWDSVYMIKPKSHFNTIRHVLPYMMEQKWGRIINCTSGAFAGAMNHANYAAANAGVLGLTYSVAKECWSYGITCNAFAPDAYTRATFELEASMLAGSKDKNVQPNERFLEMLEHTPGPENLAPFIGYLASDAAAKISASVFFVGGNNIGMYNDPEFKKLLTKPGDRWTFEELKRMAPMGLFMGYRSTAEPSGSMWG